MILRSISLKNVAGSEAPVSLPIADTSTVTELGEGLGPAIPCILMTLLYPEETSVTDVARVAGSNPDSAWRVELEIEQGQRVRISRSLSPDSLLLETRGGDKEPWQTQAQGQTPVRIALAELVRLPPPSVFEVLHFWVNTHPAPVGLLSSIGKRSGIGGPGTMILGSDDYFGNFDELREPEADLADLGSARTAPDEAAYDTYRRAKTLEFVSDHARILRERVGNISDRIDAIADGSGEMARLNRLLTDLPQLRELLPEERRILGLSDGQVDEMETRLMGVDAELSSLKSSAAGGDRVLWKVPLFMVGLGLTAALTVLSIVLGGEARRLALGNLATLSISLVGFLSWAEAREARGDAGRKRAGLERRREGQARELALVRSRRAEIREELGIGSLKEYENVVAERASVEQQMAELHKRLETALQAPEVLRLEAEKAQEEARLAPLQEARRRLGEEGESAFELQHVLRSGGIDPEVVLWRPSPFEEDLRSRVKRLGQVASRYRLTSEGGLNSRLMNSWLKLAERMSERTLDSLNLTPENVIVDGNGRDLLAELDSSMAIVVVEALRLALILTLVKGKAPGIVPVSVDVYPDRIDDALIRARFLQVYSALGQRIQFLVVTSS